MYTKKRSLRLSAMLMALVMVVGLIPFSAIAQDHVFELMAGESTQLRGEWSANGQEDWFSEDESVAVVEDGLVTGMSAGKTTITHTYYEAVEVSNEEESEPPVVIPEIAEEEQEEAEEETDPQTETEEEAESESQAEPEVQSEAKPEVETEAQPEPQQPVEVVVPSVDAAEPQAPAEETGKTETTSEDSTPLDGGTIMLIHNDALDQESSVEYVERSESWIVTVSEIEEDCITGSAEHNGVTVDVSAPVSAFPEGTTVTITPVVEDQREALQQQETLLADLLRAETLTEDAEAADPEAVIRAMLEQETEIPQETEVVSFDITFYNAEGEEVQPADQKAVAVTFTREDADMEIFHIDDEGTVEQMDADTAGDSAVVEADSFSVFAVLCSKKENKGFGSVKLAKEVEDLEPGAVIPAKTYKFELVDGKGNVLKDANGQPLQAKFLPAKDHTVTAAELNKFDDDDDFILGYVQWKNNVPAGDVYVRETILHDVEGYELDDVEGEYCLKNMVPPEGDSNWEDRDDDDDDHDSKYHWVDDDKNDNDDLWEEDEDPEGGLVADHEVKKIVAKGYNIPVGANKTTAVVIENEYEEEELDQSEDLSFTKVWDVPEGTDTSDFTFDVEINSTVKDKLAWGEINLNKQEDGVYTGTLEGQDLDIDDDDDDDDDDEDDDHDDDDVTSYTYEVQVSKDGKTWEVTVHIDIEDIDDDDDDDVEDDDDDHDEDDDHDFIRLFDDGPDDDDDDDDETVDLGDLTVTETHVNGQPVVNGSASYVDSEGKVLGRWTVTEETVDGHTTITNALTQAAEKTEHKYNNVTLTVTKVRTGTQETLAGAQFQILDAERNVAVGPVETNANGEAKLTLSIEGLAAGEYTYSLHESKAPAGYIAGADQTFTVTVTETPVTAETPNENNEIVTTVTHTAVLSGIGANVTVENQRSESQDFVNKTGFTIEKVNEASKALAGAEFQLKNGEKSIWTGITGTDGKVEVNLSQETLENLTSPAVLTLVETEAPTGYHKDTTEHTVVLKSSVKTAEPSETDNTFKTTTTWTLKTIDGKAAQEVEIVNSKITGTLELTKAVQGLGKQPVEPFSFSLYAGDKAEGTPIDILKVSRNGADTVEDLPYGTYTIVENDPADTKNFTWTGVTFNGHSADENNAYTFDFEPQQGGTVALKALNSYARKTDGVLTVTKDVTWDEQKSQAPDEEQAFGFEITIGKGSTPAVVVDEASADNRGKLNATYTCELADGESLQLTGLPYGVKYTVEETGKLPEGYTNETGKVKHTIGAEQSVTMVNHYFKTLLLNGDGELEVEKEWEDKDGREMKVHPDSVTVELKKNGTTVQTVVLNEETDWEYEFEDLPLYDSEDADLNVYTVVETKIGDQEIKDGRVVIQSADTDKNGKHWTEGVWMAGTAAADEDGDLELTNVWFPASHDGTGSFLVKKTSSYLGTVLSGAEFTLTGEGYDETLSTGENGTVQFTDLKVGTYTLTETKAPAGYQKSNQTWTVEVKADKQNSTQVSVTENSGSLLVNGWQWITGIFGEDDQVVTSLTVKNTPLVTGISKQVYADPFDGKLDTETTDNKWADSVSWTELPAETTEVTALFRVRVTGEPGAAYKVVDVTAKLVAGTSESAIPAEGYVDLYYTKTLTPGTTAETYTNEASNSTAMEANTPSKAEAKVETKLDAPGKTVTVRYWFQESYGSYHTAAYHQDSKYPDQPRTVSYGQTILAADQLLAVSPAGYALSSKNHPTPAQLRYLEISETNKVIDIYYDLNMPMVTLSAEKQWNHTATVNGTAYTNPDADELTSVELQLQRTKAPAVAESVWTTVDTKTATADNWNVTFEAQPKFVEHSSVQYVYRVTEKNAPDGYTVSGGSFDETGKAVVTNTYTPAGGDEIVDGTKAAFTVTKTDLNNQVLSGAEFTLTGKNYEKTLPTGEDGVIVFTDLTEGTYTLAETQAPAGYEKTNETWTVVVKSELDYTGSENVTITRNHFIAADAPKAITVKNTPADQTVTVTKTVAGEKVTADGKTSILPQDFRITWTENGAAQTKILTLNNAITGNDTWSWSLQIPYGTEVTFTEDNYDVQGYTCDATGTVSGTVGLENNTFAFTNTYAKDFSDETLIPDVTPDPTDPKTPGENETITDPMDYVKDGAGFRINKTANDTNALLAGAEFTLTDKNGNVLWSGTTNGESLLDVTLDGDDLENYDVTKPLELTLEETVVPTGYTKMANRAVTLTCTVSQQLIGSKWYNVHTWNAVSTADMAIVNEAEVYETLTIEKIWQNGEEQEITLHLLANGTDKQTIVLDGEIDEIETAAWTAALKDLNRYENGQLITYSVTEDALGGDWKNTIETEETEDGVLTGFVVTNYQETTDPEKPDPEKPDPEKPDPEVKPNPEKPDPEVKPDPEKPGPTDPTDPKEPGKPEGGNGGGGSHPYNPGRNDETNIPDEDVPLDEGDEFLIPDEDTPLAEIPEEEVPLFAEPTETGDSTLGLVMAALASGLSLLWLLIDNRKRKKDAE